jgi:hypothetical protein
MISVRSLEGFGSRLRRSTVGAGFVAVWLGLAVVHSGAAAATVHGAQLMDGAVKVDEDRYRSSQDWEKTLRFYRGIYGKVQGVLWRSVASTPKVKAIHIANLRKGQSWEGINVYETGGQVFIYVLRAESGSTTK